MNKFPKSDIAIYGTMNIFIGEQHNKNVNLCTLKSGNSGVYEIVNKFNGRRYIGKATDLNKRFHRHWDDLLKGKHANKKLQYDFGEIGIVNKFPDDIFEFRVILYCYPSQLTFWENLLITHLEPEYNMHKRKEIKFEAPFSLELEIIDE
ncbi:MAG TPA: GIY-YIG nuclease family protein [Nitrososphaeraceae archaeon]|nr:GIY-YIG nuclease family protein [Nitrososphaeraceae archaeon]